MDKITLTNNLQHNVTILPNDFIDHYMRKADGEYVKIYLLILRLSGSDLPIRIDELADTLELTRKDILRALNYWEKAGLLKLNDDSHPAEENTAGTSPEVGNSEAAGASFTALTVPKKTNRSAVEMEKSIKNTDLEQTVYMAETYLGRPLSASELNSFCYINDDLHFSSDLLEYLIEYCITRGKKSVRYIESVAINWFQMGIDTVKKAKEQTTLYTQNVFPVMKAFGIANRNPGPAELDYIRKWNSLGFETDIIVEACNRTLLATHQASFPYADRILEDWKKSGVRNTADIQSLDKNFHATSQVAGQTKPTGQPVAGKTNSNSFHNFEQRSYNYDDLESRLLDKNRR